MQTLYDQGGRAFWIHNVGPNGCLPAAQNNIWNRTQETFDKNGCINSWNERVVEYNRQLKDRVIKLRAQLPEAAITYVDVYTAKYNLISNAKNLGNDLVRKKKTLFLSLITGWPVQLTRTLTDSETLYCSRIVFLFMFASNSFWLFFFLQDSQSHLNNVKMELLHVKIHQAI